MAAPKELKYSNTHEWVKFIDEAAALTGLTDFAQKALGDLVFINLPSEGDGVTCGEPYMDVESVKAVADTYSQVTGVVAEVNEELETTPQKINEDPYGAWVVKIEDISEKAELMDAETYDKFCEEEEE